MTSSKPVFVLMKVKYKIAQCAVEHFPATSTERSCNNKVSYLKGNYMVIVKIAFRQITHIFPFTSKDK